MLTLAAVYLGLQLMPFATLHGILQRMARLLPAGSTGDRDLTQTVAWAIDSAGRFVPPARCLVQALTAQFLLTRRARLASLRIGVVRSPQDRFEAHAWVECEAQIVVGGVDSPTRYTRLPDLEHQTT